jgi:sugar (pentulose or hexulose) kinase
MPAAAIDTINIFIFNYRSHPLSTTPDLVIGLDCSTTACKAVVWDTLGSALAQGRAPLEMRMPQAGWHEQPAGVWWESAARALREAAAQVDPARLAGMSISAQRETLVTVDAAGNPLHDAFLWMDERCASLLPEIDALYGRERIHAETGKPLSANLSLGKLYWLRQNQPELFAKIGWVLDVHAYVAQRLTGRFATAWGCADPMGLFDMRSNRWNASLIDSLGLRLEQFPEALRSGARIGGLLPVAADACGLPAGLPLFAGLGDGQAAGLGVGAAQAGESYLNLGTAVVSGTYSERYLTDPAFRTMYGGVPGTYMFETVLLGGTYTINWFIDHFAGLPADADNPPVAVLEAAAAEVPPGALGLMLVPYWNSAMNPYWDASASGIVVGWRGVHQRQHLYRAILEGIAFEQRLHTSGVEDALRQPIKRFIAVGGGARSPLWRQIIADITGRPVYRADAPEASALGAGILAAAGAGLFASVPDAAAAMTRIAEDYHQPDPSRRAFYDRLYKEVYRELYPALREPLRRLAEITS